MSGDGKLTQTFTIVIVPVTPNAAATVVSAVFAVHASNRDEATAIANAIVFHLGQFDYAVSSVSHSRGESNHEGVVSALWIRL